VESADFRDDFPPGEYASFWLIKNDGKSAEKTSIASMNTGSKVTPSQALPQAARFDRVLYLLLQKSP
jgi:hypothetical protein